jgi:hypothetical protein
VNSLKKIISVISYPSGYMDEVKDQPVKEDILRFITVLFIGSLLYLFSYVIQKGFIEQTEVLDIRGIIVLTAMVLFLFLFNAMFFLLIICLIEHFFVLFIDRKPVFEKTMKSVIYASVLPVLFLWVPSVFQIRFSALVLLFAFMVFTFYGIHTIHGKTIDRAAFVAFFTTGCIIFLLWVGKVNLL